MCAQKRWNVVLDNPKNPCCDSTQHHLLTLFGCVMLSWIHQSVFLFLLGGDFLLWRLLQQLQWSCFSRRSTSAQHFVRRSRDFSVWRAHPIQHFFDWKIIEIWRYSKLVTARIGTFASISNEKDAETTSGDEIHVHVFLDIPSVTARQSATAATRAWPTSSRSSRSCPAPSLSTQRSWSVDGSCHRHKDSMTLILPLQ